MVYNEGSPSHLQDLARHVCPPQTTRPWPQRSSARPPFSQHTGAQCRPTALATAARSWRVPLKRKHGNRCAPFPQAPRRIPPWYDQNLADRKNLEAVDQNAARPEIARCADQKPASRQIPRRADQKPSRQKIAQRADQNSNAARSSRPVDQNAARENFGCRADQKPVPAATKRIPHGADQNSANANKPGVAD